MDQLQLRRLKKRKLALKDIIARLESELIPDQPAQYHAQSPLGTIGYSTFLELCSANTFS